MNSSAYHMEETTPAPALDSMHSGPRRVRLSFRSKLMLLLMGSTMISVLVVGIIASYFAERELKNRIYSQLDALSAAREHEINSLIEQDYERAALVASRTQLRSRLTAIESGSPSAQADLDKVNEIIDDAKASVDEINSITVTDRNGLVMASTAEGFAGSNLASSSLFTEGSAGPYLDRLQSWEDGLHYDVSTPMVDSASGQLIGVAIISFNQDHMEEILSQRKGLGESGELVIGQNHGSHIDLWYVSSIEGGDGSIRTTFLGSETAIPMQMAVRGERGTVVADDYKGIEVLASYMPVGETGWGLVEKIDVDEAFESIGTLQKYLSLAGILLIAGSFIAAWLLARLFSRRILALRDGVTAVTAGELNTRLDIRGEDELGELGDAFNRMISTLRDDRSTLIRAEEQLQRSYTFTENVINGIADPTMVIEIDDYRVTLANEAVRSNLNGLDPAAEGMTCHETSHGRATPCSGPLEPCPVRQVVETGEAIRLVHTHINSNGVESYVDIIATPVFDEDGNVTQVIESCRDITDLKLVEKELRQTLTELERSNAELQQFANIASHDLQEPLRIIASYVQLLRERYGGKLDSDADDFIEYAVDGANRMQETITDLLAYSSISMHDQNMKAVNTAECLHNSLENLTVAINESGASVDYGQLPTVYGDCTQLTQLFQNLIGNAIKFRGASIPEIKIATEEHPGEWLFSISDNGIGMDPQYAERIFVIFQRLNTREEYPGTGVGLAICKRIVERHGGQIWAESSPSEGSTFYFTIKKPGIHRDEKRP